MSLPDVCFVTPQLQSHGLDRAMTAAAGAMNSVLAMTGSDPTLDSDAMYIMWNLKPDIEGGVEWMDDVVGDLVRPRPTLLLNINSLPLLQHTSAAIDPAHLTHTLTPCFRHQHIQLRVLELRH